MNPSSKSDFYVVESVGIPLEKATGFKDDVPETSSINTKFRLPKADVTEIFNKFALIFSIPQLDFHAKETIAAWDVTVFTRGNHYIISMKDLYEILTNYFDFHHVLCKRNIQKLVSDANFESLKLDCCRINTQYNGLTCQYLNEAYQLRSFFAIYLLRYSIQIKDFDVTLAFDKSHPLSSLDTVDVSYFLYNTFQLTKHGLTYENITLENINVVDVQKGDKIRLPNQNKKPRKQNLKTLKTHKLKTFGFGAYDGLEHYSNETKFAQVEYHDESIPSKFSGSSEKFLIQLFGVPDLFQISQKWTFMPKFFRKIIIHFSKNYEIHDSKFYTSDDKTSTFSEKQFEAMEKALRFLNFDARKYPSETYPQEIVNLFKQDLSNFPTELTYKKWSLSAYPYLKNSFPYRIYPVHNKKDLLTSIFIIPLPSIIQDIPVNFAFPAYLYDPSAQIFRAKKKREDLEMSIKITKQLIFGTKGVYFYRSGDKTFVHPLLFQLAKRVIDINNSNVSSEEKQDLIQKTFINQNFMPEIFSENLELREKILKDLVSLTQFEIMTENHINRAIYVSEFSYSKIAELIFSKKDEYSQILTKIWDAKKTPSQNLNHFMLQLESLKSKSDLVPSLKNNTNRLYSGYLSKTRYPASLDYIFNFTNHYVTQIEDFEVFYKQFTNWAWHGMMYHAIPGQVKFDIPSFSDVEQIILKNPALVSKFQLHYFEKKNQQNFITPTHNLRVI